MELLCKGVLRAFYSVIAKRHLYNRQERSNTRFPVRFELCAAFFVAALMMQYHGFVPLACFLYQSVRMVLPPACL
ncbi:MAG: hypothetical protein ACLTDX_13130 [[Clostridium] innocuum]